MSSLQARMDLNLETEGDFTELDTELSKQQHSFTGFARQMWAYITVKQLFSPGGDSFFNLQE